MFNDISITIAGNITAAPEKRFTSANKTVVSFTVAHTPRRQDPATQQWTDGEPTFMACEAWEATDNIAASLQRGTRVLVVGRLRTERFTPTSGDNAGQEVVRTKLVVDEIGPSLRWATAEVVRNERPPAAHSAA